MAMATPGIALTSADMVLPKMSAEALVASTNQKIADLESIGILSVHNFKQERTLAMWTERHMAPRLGEKVFQVASESFPIISARGMARSLGVSPDQIDKSSSIILSTMEAIGTTLSPIVSKFSDVKIFGLSKPLKRPSEKYTRVIATLLFAEIHTAPDSFAMDTMTVGGRGLYIARNENINKDKQKMYKHN